MINTTWFYNTNLKDYPELQETLLLETNTNLKLESQILSGNVGVGKTHNALILAKNYIKETFKNQNTWHYSFEPCFVNYMEFLQILSDMKFGSEENKAKAYYRLKDIKEAPFLIFDDLRAEHSSKYEKTTLDNALLDLLSVFWAGRKNRILIVTTNNTKKEIEKTYSQAVCSRLFGICKYLEVTGQDKRQVKKA